MHPALLFHCLRPCLDFLSVSHSCRLQVTSKCRLEQHAQTCINHIIKQQLHVPAGLFSSIQPQHAEALFNAMQQALQQAQGQLQQAAVPAKGLICERCRRCWYIRPAAAVQLDIGGAIAAACLLCGARDAAVHEPPPVSVAAAAAALEAAAAAAAAAEDFALLSQSLGSTEDGSDEGDSDDEGEGSDEAMSQDSNSQDVDDDADGDDGEGADSDDDDLMESGSDDDDSDEVSRLLL
jgi:hypothetical protein